MHFEDDCMPKQRLWSKLQELQLAICLVSFQHGFHCSIIAVLQILWWQKSYKTAKDRQNRISRNIIWAVQIQWLVGPCGCHTSSAFGIQLDSTIVCWCLLCKFKPGNVVSQNFPALHASQWLHYASQSHRFTDDDLGIVSPYKIQDTHVYLLHQCIFCIVLAVAGTCSWKPKFWQLLNVAGWEQNQRLEGVKPLVQRHGKITAKEAKTLRLFSGLSSETLLEPSMDCCKH